MISVHELVAWVLVERFDFSEHVADHVPIALHRQFCQDVILPFSTYTYILPGYTYCFFAPHDPTDE